MMQHLLLLHGAIGAKDQLQPLADALTKDFIIHTLNFNGHGGEPGAGKEFSIPGFAEDVRRYLNQQAITSTHIFGYSMGGYVALYLAKYHPALVNRVITLATKFEWTPAIAEKESAMLNPSVIAEKVPAFAETLQKRHQPGDWKVVLEKTKQLLHQLGENNELSLADYKAIFSPCLLLLGDNDKMVTHAETMAIVQHLPNGKFKMLENTPHPIEKVNVSTLGQIIRIFLDC